MKLLNRIWLLALVSAFAFTGCLEEEEPTPDPQPSTELPTENLPTVNPITATAFTEVDTSGDTIYVVEMSAIPFNVTRFKEVQAQIGNTPHGAAAMLIVGLTVYQEYNGEGERCLITAVDENLKVESTQFAYEGFRLMDTERYLIQTQIRDKPTSMLGWIYYKGAAPNNGYTPTAPPYRIEFETTQFSIDDNGEWRLYTRTQGADSPRPVRVRQLSNGQWRAREFSSLMTGHKPVE